MTISHNLLKRQPEAGDVYQQISLRHPDSVEALNGKGVVLAQQSNLSGAADAFRKALALRPQDVPARNNLALAMLLRGEVDVARAMWEDLDRSDGSSQVNATLALARERSRTPVASQHAALTESIAAASADRQTAHPAGGSQQPLRAQTAGQPAASTLPSLRAPTAMLSPMSGEQRIVSRASAFWRGLVFTAGNAGGTELVVDGVATASLGGLGVIRRNVPLDPELIKDGKLPTQISVARAAVSPVSSQGLSGPP
jgi:tetratricopeptide (TPR) repeat protein